MRKRPLGPQVEVVDIFARSAESTIARHDLLADHLVRIKAEELGKATLDLAEVRLSLEF